MNRHLSSVIFSSALLLVFLGGGAYGQDLSRDPHPFHEMMSNDIIEVSTLPTPSGPFGPASPTTANPRPGFANANSTTNNKTEPGFIDSIVGEGTQSRIASSVSGWVTQKVKTNPGCVERFICESYKQGRVMNGVPYYVMQLTNAAVGFMMAQTFDQTIDIKELTRAARFGNDDGICDTYKCDVMDGQLRTVGDFLGSLEEFVSSIFNSVSNSFNIGRK